MKKNNNRKGFTLVELLAVIVILAILMVAAGAAVMSTMNNAKVSNFKNEALSVLNTASNAYTTVSMSATDSNNYLVNSDNGKYKGMCITVEGLVENGYLDKDLGGKGTSAKIRGFVLVEVPFGGGATKYSIWFTDSTYGIYGYEKNSISKQKVSDTYTGVTTLLTTAPSDVKNGIVGTAGTVPTTATDGLLAIIDKTIPSSGNVQPVSIVSPSEDNGGTGASYKTIKCIHGKIS